VILSQTSQYALRAAAYLAEAPDDAGWTPVADIAEALDAPRNYLSKILHQLARRGVLTSARGPGGGFRLAAASTEIRLIDIVEPVDAPLAERACLLGRGVCNEARPCAAHARWRDLNDAVTRFLERTTLSDLTKRAGSV
jgi:Rrf2 family protein